MYDQNLLLARLYKKSIALVSRPCNVLYAEQKDVTFLFPKYFSLNIAECLDNLH